THLERVPRTHQRRTVAGCQLSRPHLAVWDGTISETGTHGRSPCEGPNRRRWVAPDPDAGAGRPGHQEQQSMSRKPLPAPDNAKGRKRALAALRAWQRTVYRRVPGVTSHEAFRLAENRLCSLADRIYRWAGRYAKDSDGRLIIDPQPIHAHKEA